MEDNWQNRKSTQVGENTSGGIAANALAAWRSLKMAIVEDKFMQPSSLPFLNFAKVLVICQFFLKFLCGGFYFFLLIIKELQQFLKIS